MVEIACVLAQWKGTHRKLHSRGAQKLEAASLFHAGHPPLRQRARCGVARLMLAASLHCNASPASRRCAPPRIPRGKHVLQAANPSHGVPASAPAAPRWSSCSCDSGFQLRLTTRAAWRRRPCQHSAQPCALRQPSWLHALGDLTFSGGNRDSSTREESCRRSSPHRTPVRWLKKKECDVFLRQRASRPSDASPLQLRHTRHPVCCLLVLLHTRRWEAPKRRRRHAPWEGPPALDTSPRARH